MVVSFPYSSDAYRVLVGPYHGDGAPKRGPRTGCLILLPPPRGPRDYAMSRTSISPLEPRCTLKGNSSVVAIGVDRRSVGSGNSVRWRLPLHHKSTGALRVSSVHLTVEEIRALPNILVFAIFALYLTNGMP